MAFVTIPQRTFHFSVLVLRTFSTPRQHPAFVTVKSQVMRSATSIGANAVEAQYACSKKQFLQYYQIALRSAKETEYWLQLANEIAVVPKQQIEELVQENIAIIKILTTSLRHGKLYS